MLGLTPIYRTSYESVIWFTFWNLFLLLPWVLPYWVITIQSNRIFCQGLPWNYGHFARWAFVGMIIYVVAMIPINFRASEARKANGKRAWHPILHLMDQIFIAFGLATWIYACVALARRGNCDNNALEDIIWANVLVPAIILAIGLLFVLLPFLCTLPLLKKVYNKINAKYLSGEELDYQQQHSTRGSRAGSMERMNTGERVVA